MGSLFSKPKPIKPPPVPEPPPVPTVTSEAETFAGLQERRRSGMAQTFLTGALTPETTGKKTTFG